MINNYSGTSLLECRALVWNTPIFLQKYANQTAQMLFILLTLIDRTVFPHSWPPRDNLTNAPLLLKTEIFFFKSSNLSESSPLFVKKWSPQTYGLQGEKRQLKTNEIKIASMLTHKKRLSIFLLTFNLFINSFS